MCEIQVILEGLIIITGALSRKALAFNNQSKIENHQSAIRGGGFFCLFSKWICGIC